MRHIRLATVLTAGWLAKEWPVERFAEVVLMLRRDWEIEPVLLGAGARAVSYGERFSRLVPGTCNLINQTTLREMAAVLRHCDAYLGGDTGPLHLSAAVHLPGVALFVNRTAWAPDGINSSRFGPWQSAIRTLAPQAPLPGCAHGCVAPVAHCIKQIDSGQVAAVLRDVLRRGD